MPAKQIDTTIKIKLDAVEKIKRCKTNLIANELRVGDSTVRGWLKKNLK